MEELIQCLGKYQHDNYANVIAGDFNCPKIDWARLTSPCDAIHRPLLDFVTNAGFVQVVEAPTRLGNFLDLVFTDDPIRVCSTVTEPSFGHSDHDMISFKIILNYTHDSPCPTPR